MADGKRARQKWTRAMWSGYLVAFAGLAVVMVRVPGGLSVAERIGWWFFICGTLSVGVFLKTWKQD